MLKNMVQLEHKVGENAFHFLCSADSKLEDVKEALIQFIAHVAGIQKASKSVPPAPVDPVVADSPSEDPATPEV